MSWLFVVFVAFLSTNTDGASILIAASCDKNFTRGEIFYTYCLVGVAVIAASSVLGASSSLLPAGALQYVGVIPAAMGVWRLRSCQRSDLSAPSNRLMFTSVRAIGLACAFLACSMDNLAVYSALLARQAGEGALLTCAELGILYVLSAIALLRLQSRFASPIQKWSRGYIPPVMLIFVGTSALLHGGVATGL